MNFASRCQTAARLIRLLLISLLMTSGSSSLAVTITSLGVLPGYSGSRATAVSADGSVVVGYCFSNAANTSNQAFRWSRSEGIQRVGPVGTAATGVSGDGSVIVGTIYDAQATSGEGFQWNKSASGGGSFQRLGFSAVYEIEETGTSYSEIHGVSADGNTLVGSQGFSNSYGYSWLAPMRYTSGGGWEFLGAAEEFYRAEARAISSNGSTVVGRSLLTDTSHNLWAFQKIGSGINIIRGRDPDYSYSGAYAISADGSVTVGNSGTTFYSGDDVKAVRWGADQRSISLGFLRYQGSLASTAYGVSEKGAIIVGAANISRSEKEAFIWTAETGTKNLEDSLSQSDAVLWNLDSANAITPSGNCIVGEGRLSG